MWFFRFSQKLTLSALKRAITYKNAAITTFLIVYAVQENAVSRKSRSKFFPKVNCLLSARSLRDYICETIWNLTLKFWRHISEYISNRMRWLSKNWFFYSLNQVSPLKRNSFRNRQNFLNVLIEFIKLSGLYKML